MKRASCTFRDLKTKKVKRYWYRDWRDNREYITNAYSISDLKRKVGTDKIQIEKVWYGKKNLKADDLILLY